MRDFYINLDFDVSLRPDGGGGRRATATRLGRDLAPAFLLTGGPEDRVLLQDPVPAEFPEYLRERGFEPALAGPSSDPEVDREFVPYGWNADAMALAQRYASTPGPPHVTPHRPPGAPVHPDLAVVRTVNSRTFSAELERSLFGGDHVLGVLDSIRGLEPVLRSSDWPGGYVVKANHSNASLGNRRLRTGKPSAEDRRVIERLFEESGSVVLEAWQQRVLDFVVTMRVGRDGTAESLHVHEIVNTAEGAFLGALFGTGSGDGHVVPTSELKDAGRKVAARLAEAGYFGPACLDAYTWTDGKHTHLRPLVDLNARLGMSQPFREVSRRIGDDRVCYGRFFSARRFPFGGDQAVFLERLGRRNYSPETRRGILLASPLQLGEGENTRTARRFAVVFVGDSRDDVLAMDTAFRNEFDR